MAIGARPLAQDNTSRDAWSPSEFPTQTFSISGLMTPSKPVSYKNEDMANDSNGFGTLAEAGWSQQLPIHGT